MFSSVTKIIRCGTHCSTEIGKFLHDCIRVFAFYLGIASCQQTVTTVVGCETAISEVLARINGQYGTWHGAWVFASKYTEDTGK